MKVGPGKGMRRQDPEGGARVTGPRPAPGSDRTRRMLPLSKLLDPQTTEGEKTLKGNRSPSVVRGGYENANLSTELEAYAASKWISVQY